MYRAISVCPRCATSAEVWNHYGTFFPNNVERCVECSAWFDPRTTLISFLELKDNISISTANIAAQCNNMFAQSSIL